MSSILFDIGGTKTRLAVSTDGETLSDLLTFPTPVKPEAFLKKLKAYVDEVGAPRTIVGGIRGVLDEDKSRLFHDSLLVNWQHFPLLEEIADQTGSAVSAVRLENDAALAGLGEAVFGAGKDAETVVYHDISTGVGGAKISKKLIEASSVGMEPGHQVLDIDRTILGEEISPTLENLISGRAVEERMGMKPQEIPQDDVIWDELAGYLAQGLRNSILYWSPEIVVLGGSMMTGEPHITLETVRKETVKVLDGVVECPFITLAECAPNSGLYGALALSGTISKKK